LKESIGKPESFKTADYGLRKLLIGAYLFGSIGIGVELLLMEHTEGIWQLIPVVLLPVSLPVFIWLWLSQKQVVNRLFQGIMALFALSGLLGVALHFDGKAEFKLEIDPELSGLPLFWECMHGSSLPPVLAPAAMILLAMVGLACARCARFLKSEKP
jgi:hypothetical protein